MNKQVELYDTEVGIKKQNADTAASNSLRQWQEFWAKGAEEEKEAVGNAFAAYDAAYKETNDDEAATGAFIDSLSVNYPEAVERFAGQTIRPEMAEAAIMTADEQLIRGRDKNNPSLQNFGDAEGNVLETHVVGSPGYYEAVERGLNRIGDVSQTQKTRDLSAEEAAAEGREHLAIADDMRATLRGYRKTPGAGGIGGFITDKIGGFAGSLPRGIGQALENAIANFFSGASPAEVAQLRASAETDLPLFLKMITGDTSRYSDRDVELARGAQKATSPTASPEQIVASYSNMARVSYRQAFRSMKLAQQDLPFKFDGTPEDDASIQSFISALREDGMSDEVIRELIIDVRSLTTNEWKDRIGIPVDFQ
jgi:hypothetical protein